MDETVKRASWWSRGVAILLVAAAAAGGAYGLFTWTSGMGHASVLDIAREAGYCASETDCAEGVAALYSVASDEFGMSGAHLDWCIGVDSWANARVRRGGWLKDAAVWLMYLPCGTMTSQEP